MAYQNYAVAGSMNATIADAPAAGTHKYRIVARITTNAPSAGKTLTFTGKVDLKAQ